MVSTDLCFQWSAVGTAHTNSPYKRGKKVFEASPRNEWYWSAKYVEIISALNKLNLDELKNNMWRFGWHTDGWMLHILHFNSLTSGWKEFFSLKYVTKGFICYTCLYVVREKTLWCRKKNTGNVLIINKSILFLSQSWTFYQILLL